MKINFSAVAQPLFGQKKATKTIDIKAATFKDGIPYCENMSTPYSGIIESNMSDGSKMRMQYKDGLLTKKERSGNRAYNIKCNIKVTTEPEFLPPDCKQLLSTYKNGSVKLYKSQDGSFVELDTTGRVAKCSLEDNTDITYSYSNPDGFKEYPRTITYDYSRNPNSDVLMKKCTQNSANAEEIILEITKRSGEHISSSTALQHSLVQKKTSKKTIKPSIEADQKKLQGEQIVEIIRTNKKGGIIEYRTKSGSIIELDSSKRKTKETKADGTVITWDYHRYTGRYNYTVKYDYTNSKNAPEGILYEVKDREMVNYPERIFETCKTDGTVIFIEDRYGTRKQETRPSGVTSFFEFGAISKEETDNGLTFNYREKTLSKKTEDGTTEIFDISDSFREIRNMSDEDKKAIDTSKFNIAKIKFNEGRIKEIGFFKSGQISQMKIGIYNNNDINEIPCEMNYYESGNIKSQVYGHNDFTYFEVFFNDSKNGEFSNWEDRSGYRGVRKPNEIQKKQFDPSIYFTPVTETYLNGNKLKEKYIQTEKN